MAEQTQTPAQSQPEQKKKNMAWAIVAYILFFIPLFTDAKNDPFVKYHIKQGLVLFIVGIITGVIAGLPFLHWLSWIFNLVTLVLFIIGILNVVNGKETPLPIIGKFAEKFNF